MAVGIFIVLGFVILLGFVGSLFFKKTKIPEALFLIIIGILLGPVFGILDPAEFLSFADIITALMLIVIMLDNGLSFDIFRVVKALPVTIIYSVSILFLTTFSITSVLVFLFGFHLLEAAIIALVISGTTTDVITVITSRMKIKRESRQLLIIDSVVNDLQIIPFFILLGFAKTSSLDGLSFIVPFLSVPLAIAFGVVAAILWLYVIGKFLGKHPLNYIATIAILFILYGIVQTFQGSGPIAILTFSLILGNALGIFRKFKIKDGIKKKFTIYVLRDLKRIEFDISFLIRTIFFVFLGVIFSFSGIHSSSLWMWPALIAVILLSRYIPTLLLARRHREYRRDKGPLTWIMPRGYVAAALAFMAYGSGIFTRSIVDITLMVIFTTTFIAIAYSVWHGKKK